jgi:hypothetical protein
MGEKFTLSAIPWKEGKLQIAWYLELDIVSQGKKWKRPWLICVRQSTSILKMKTPKFQQIDRLIAGYGRKLRLTSECIYLHVRYR